MSFWDNFNKNHLIAAHRGDRYTSAENTMEAFENSIGKCDFVEFDVGFSKDGVAVILHDDTLKRTSNADKLDGFYPPYNLCDYNYQQLLELNMDKRAAKKQQIPTLKETLLFFRSKNMPVNVEIKDLKKTKFDKIATKAVIEIINECDMVEMTMLSSFNHNYIKEAKKSLPQISTAALQEKRHPLDTINYLSSLKVSSYNIEKGLIDKNLIKELKNIGINTCVYTINSQRELKKAFSLGAEAVFTDFLEEMPL